MGKIGFITPQNNPDDQISFSREGQDLRKAASLVQPYSSRGANQWLGNFVEGARVIGIGEPTHGTADCFKAQLTLAKQLITDHNVRGVYAEIPSSSAVKALVAAASGRDAVRAIIEATGHPSWMNDEILDLVMFIHQWNNEHPQQQVHFAGLDIHESHGGSMLEAITTAHPSIRQWARNVVSFRPPAPAPISDFGLGVAVAPEATASLDISSNDTLYSRAQELIDGGKRLRYLANAGSLQSDLMEGCLTWLSFVAEQLRASSAGEPLAPTVRDTLMAASAERCISRLGVDQRAVVLGHNAHVAFGAPGDFAQGLGTALKQKLGSRYKAILTTTDGGFVTSHRAATSPSEVCSLTFPPRLSHESAFRALSTEPFIFRVDQAMTDPMHEGLARESKPMRCMGYRYGPNVSDQFKSISLGEQCDGVVFFPQSRASGFEQERLG